MRAIVSNGDFAQYCRYYLAREHERIHRICPPVPNLALVA